MQQKIGVASFHPTHSCGRVVRKMVSSKSFRVLGFPRGEAVATKQRHFGTDVFVVTDEGWRWLKVSDFSGERWKPERTPFIQLHSLTNLSPPLISLFYQTVPKCHLIKNPASPRGKPRTQKPLDNSIQRSTLLHGLWVAPTMAVQNNKPVPSNEVHPLCDSLRAACGGCSLA